MVIFGGNTSFSGEADIADTKVLRFGECKSSVASPNLISIIKVKISHMHGYIQICHPLWKKCNS